MEILAAIGWLVARATAAAVLLAALAKALKGRRK